MPTPGSVSPNVASFSPRRLRHQPALALLLGAPLQERQRVQPDVDALDDPERRVGALELLAQDREADVVHPGAALGLGDRGAEEALLAPSASKTSRWTSPFSSHSRMWGRISASANARAALLDEPVLVGQREIDHDSRFLLDGLLGRAIVPCGTVRAASRRAAIATSGRPDPVLSGDAR